MRIGYIVSRYPAVSHTFVQREVLGLRKLGWEVTTISIRRAQQKELLTETDRAEAAATRVIVPTGIVALLAAIFVPLVKTPGCMLRAFSQAWRLRRPGLRGAVWALFYFIEALLVHRLCRRAGIRHLHAHFANVASDVALIASILNGGPSAAPQTGVTRGTASSEGGTFSFTMHGPTEFFDVAAHRLAEKAAAARFVICISDFARSQLMSMLPMEQWRKLEVVHCGVDLEQFAAPRGASAGKNDHQEVIGSIHKQGDAHEILCVARLTSVKGHAVLLQAVAELLLREHAVSLTLIGDGPLRPELERRADVLGIGEHVKFLGNVGQDVIAQHFARADMFALPSFAEGVPVVLMEAMAARCPVIATRIAGISELIEHGATGTLVPPGRADQLTDAMERLLVNRQAAERMALAGLEKVRREFNLNKLAPQLATIFRKHLEPRGWMTGRAERRHHAAESWPATRDQAAAHADHALTTRHGLESSAPPINQEPRGAA